MGINTFYILSCGFAFSTLIFAFSFQSLTPNPSSLAPNVIMRRYLRVDKVLYISRGSSTDAESSLQIHPFLTNKANFRKSQVNVTIFITMNYDKMDTWSGRKNKAKTKPIQSQYKPKQTQPVVSMSNLFYPHRYHAYLNFLLWDHKGENYERAAQPSFDLFPGQLDYFHLIGRLLFLLTLCIDDILFR